MCQAREAYLSKLLKIEPVQIELTLHFNKDVREIGNEFDAGWMEAARDRELDNLAVQSMERRYSPGFKRGD
jgi:hypothetical protein